MKKETVLNLIYFFTILAYSVNVSFAEGSKQFRPSAADSGSLHLEDVGGDGTKFALVNVDEAYRMNVHICNIGEIINIGFSQKQNLRVRIIAPDGSVAMPFTSLNFNSPTSPGRIISHAQALNGPQPLNPNGYIPLSVTATMVGDYYIEFENANPPFATTGVNSPTIPLFDITVTRNGKIEEGRLWSKAWQIICGAYTDSFRGTIFPYTTDKIVTKIDFNGIRPNKFVIAANSTGTGNTGNLVMDRRSTTTYSVRPEYKLFVNNPDPDCYESGELGELDTTFITGCPGNYCLNVNVTAPGSVIFYIEANGSPGHQEGTRDRIIQQFVPKGPSCVKWDGKDGLGDPIGNNVSVGASVAYQNGVTHLPLYDVEHHSNGYIVSYVRPIPPSATSNRINLYWDDSKIMQGTAIDGKINFTGCTKATGCHAWTDRGAISVGNKGCDPVRANQGQYQYECPQTINTWWIVKESNSEFSFKRDEKDIDANRRDPLKGKGNDTLICESDLTLKLNGLVSGAKGIKWSLLKGSGIIGNDTLLSTIYTFQKTDKQGDNITFLISTRGDECPPVYDTMNVFFDRTKTITIAPVNKVCSLTPSLNINATLKNAGKITWEGGQGVFNPNRTSSTFTYKPTESEILNGTIPLYARSVDNIISCPNVKDSIKLQLAIPPQVMAPPDTMICSGDIGKTLKLQGTVKYTDTIFWSTDNPASKLSTPNSINTEITLTNNLRTVVSIEATKKGCPSAKDQIIIDYYTPPSLTAMATPTCEKDRQIILNASIKNSLNDDVFAWSKVNLNGSFLTDSTEGSNKYYPSREEIDSGKTKLSFRHVKIGKCPAKDTILNIPIPLDPKANAGPDSIVCRGTKIVQKTSNVSKLTYEWRENSSANNVVISRNDSVILTMDNDKIIFLQVKTPEGCMDIDSAEIKVLDPPIIELPPHICFYDSTTITANVQNTPTKGTYLWTRSQKPLNESSNSLLVTSEGNYIYSYKFNHCIASDSIWVTLPPKANIIDKIDCIGNQATIIATQSPNYIYHWNNDTPTQDNTFTTNILAGTQYINLLIKDTYGCIDTTIGKITGVPKPSPILSAKDICDGETGNIEAILSDSSIDKLYSVEKYWSYNKETFSFNNWQNISFTKSGTFELQMKIGDCVAKDSIKTKVFDSPKIEIKDNLRYCFDELDSLQLQPNNTFLKYRWYSSSENVISNHKMIKVHPIVDTEYILEVENEYGCISRKPLFVKITCPPRLFLPNAITPRSQDINSYLNIFGDHFKNFELTIFNRWGEIIFHSNDPLKCWDGTYRNEEMPIGVYPWIVTYDAKYEEFKGYYKKEGDVTVIR